MPSVKIDNVSINIDNIETVLKDIKKELYNKKLTDIIPKHDYIRITCPVHKNGLEKSPSASIYTGDDIKIGFGKFHCFTCNCSGTLDKFINYCFDKDRDSNFGKEWLLKHYEHQEINKIIELPTISKQQKQIKSVSNFLNESILDNFQDWCPYMAARKLKQDIVNKFKVKYDSISKSIVFPVWDINNNLVMLTKRSTEKKHFMIDKNKEKPLYLFNYIINKKFPYFIITESQIDALTSWGYGMPACATIGSLSQSQIDTLNKSGIKAIITFFDKDDAGDIFTLRFNENIANNIIVINLKSNIENKKDINDLTEEEFNDILNQHNLTWRLNSLDF